MTANHHLPHAEVEELTLAELTRALDTGRWTSARLVDAYRERVDAIDVGLDLRSIIVWNPEADSVAAARDQERQAGTVRGPMHGVPILLKDNIDTTGDTVGPMGTTAGSLALSDSTPGDDATVTSRLVAAGAIIVGKTNLSEWANFRSPHSSSGWSAVGGACRNPYVLDRNPAGSSSGSGAAVSANLAMAAIGTETDGSIVSPANANGIVGIKPTVGLTSRAGVVPISHRQDTVGPMARTVADAAVVLGIVAGADPRDPATTTAAAWAAADTHGPDYTRFLDQNGLAGARIGVARQLCDNAGPHTLAVFDRVVEQLADAGATVVDPVAFPSFDEVDTDSPELFLMRCELKTDLAAYLATRVGGPKSLAEVIAFNRDNAHTELRWFGQEHFEAADATGGLDDPDYPGARRRADRLSRADGIDAIIEAHRLDAIVAPTGGPAPTTDLVNGGRGGRGSSGYAAMAGYPLLTVPMGSVAGLPVGLTFMGPAWSEPTLIRLASGFEHHFGQRTAPTFLPTLAR